MPLDRGARLQLPERLDVAIDGDDFPGAEVRIEELPSPGADIEHDLVPGLLLR